MINLTIPIMSALFIALTIPIISFPNLLLSCRGDALQQECCHLRPQVLKIIDDLLARIDQVE
jgi:hypothetical protein